MWTAFVIIGGIVAVGLIMVLKARVCGREKRIAQQAMVAAVGHYKGGDVVLAKYVMKQAGPLADPDELSAGNRMVALAIMACIDNDKWDEDAVWAKCIAMWEWIAAEFVNDSFRHIAIIRLKTRYLKEVEVPPGGLMKGSCYFCDAAGRCCDILMPSKDCPGVKVDPEFHCERGEYSYREDPVAFLAELKRLDGIRLSMKGGA